MSDSDFETKDIFLKNKETGVVIGLHETGTYFEGKWRPLEAWINSYDDDLSFRDSIARVFGPIEEERDVINVDGEWEEIDIQEEMKARESQKGSE